MGIQTIFSWALQKKINFTHSHYRPVCARRCCATGMYLMALDAPNSTHNNNNMPHLGGFSAQPSTNEQTAFLLRQNPNPPQTQVVNTTCEIRTKFDLVIFTTMPFSAPPQPHESRPLKRQFCHMARPNPRLSNQAPPVIHKYRSRL